MTDTPAERGAESNWTRLRRRKVVQWGLVYVAAAWGFLQGLEYVSESFHWPEQLRQIALLVLLIGLPIALVLAYYHGDQGQQRISTPEFAILTLLLLLGGGAFWYYQRASEAGSAAAPAATTAKPDASAGARDARPSVAVLPFANRSEVEKDAFFVDGIHDDILTQLSKVSALRVISRTSVQQFRDTQLTMKAIADQLGVTKILEGGVQRAGDRVRINVQLIDAGTDAHLWAESYDRELTAANIFDIQSEVAAAIATALKASLTAGEKALIDAIPTRNLEAWQAYQLGKQRMAKRNSSALADAERMFRNATALDPRFALAWVGLADTLMLQATYSGRPTTAAADQAELAVNRALKLNQNLAEAWASAGGIAQDRLQFERAEHQLRRAIALNANYATAYHWLSMTLTLLGRREEALAAAEHAVALDPLSAIVNNQLGAARRDVGRFNDALTAFGQAIEIDPTMAIVHFSVGALYAYGFGRLDKAWPWFEKAVTLDPGDPTSLAALTELSWDLGDEAEAGRWLSRALAIGEETAYTNVVAALFYLDRKDMELVRKHSQVAAELDQFYLVLMRDVDFRREEYATARGRYAKVYPQLFAKQLPQFNDYEAYAAIELALVLQRTGEREQAKALLDRSEAYFRTIPRMGPLGYAYSDVRIHALRGEKAKALAALREAQRAGCNWIWRYYRDFDPTLASIRNEPEFKAIFADIERDMAKQRAALAARPKDAPLELAETGT